MSDADGSRTASGTLEEPQVRAMFDRIARRLRPHELGHDGGPAPPLARARRRSRAASGRATRARRRDAAPATWRSSWRGASAAAARSSAATSPSRCSSWRARKAPDASRWSSGRNALELPYDDASSTPRRSASARATSPTSIAACREMARVVRPGGHVVVLEITTPHAPAAVDVLPRLVRPRRAAARARRRRRRRLQLPAELGQALPRAAGAGRGDGALPASRIRYVLTAGGIIAIHVGEVA